MYIDRIRIDWDKVSEDSYLTRIPATISLPKNPSGLRVLLNILLRSPIIE